MKYHQIFQKSGNFPERNALFETKFAKWVHSKFFKKNGVLCDLGAGLGLNSIAFKKLGYEVSAVDFDDSAFKELKEKGIACLQVNLSRGVLPFEDNSFDCFFMKAIIEHVREPLVLLSEVRRCLKPGGKVFILTMNWKTAKHIFYDDPTHCSPFTEVSLKEAMKMSGLKPLAIKRFRNVPYIWKWFDSFPFNFKFFSDKELIGIGMKHF